MGEFGWKGSLKQFLDNDRAKTLAAAWDGDRYLLYEQKQTKKLILVTRLHLDSEDHARDSSDNIPKRSRRNTRSARICFAVRTFFLLRLRMAAYSWIVLGDECVTIEGTTRIIFDGFTKALIGLWLRNHPSALRRRQRRRP